MNDPVILGPPDIGIHLRDIDRSLAIVGGPATAWAMVLNPGHIIIPILS